MNPLSQYQSDMSVEEELADTLISWPFTRAMCAPVSDGAAAAVLVHERALPRFSRRRAIRIRSVELVSGTPRDIDDFEHHIGALAARAAYERAGIGPCDVDV